MAKTVTLGSTGITADKNGFGAIPIQRLDDDGAVKLLRRAFEGGMTYYDTARMYTDSEHKIGLAFAGMRDKIFIATKTGASTPEEFWEHLKTSLSELQTDYIDVHQFHNPKFTPKPGDGSGLYEAMLEAKRQGKIRHIGFTNHRLELVSQAAESGLYEVVQYPFSYLSEERDIQFVKRCGELNVGFVAMKALSGGLISSAAGAYAFMAGYPDVLPIWGIQLAEELEEFLSFTGNPPSMDDPKIKAGIEKDRVELTGEFCRGCGYCMPCPADIKIYMCARIAAFARRTARSLAFSEESRDMVENIKNCTRCGQCKTRCPYGLDIPTLLEKNCSEYMEELAKTTTAY